MDTRISVYNLLCVQAVNICKHGKPRLRKAAKSAIEEQRKRKEIEITHTVRDKSGKGITIVDWSIPTTSGKFARNEGKVVGIKE